jgi:hypothetical protein
MLKRKTRKKISSPLSVASTKDIDSTFTPIGRADSTTRQILAIAFEVEDLKKSKI